MPLHADATALLGRPYSEVPCWRLLELLSPLWPPAGKEVPCRFLQAGDFVLFGDGPDHSAGVYLGSGKVIASFPDTGVILVPWRYVRGKIFAGVRNG